eukprot:CAMPEP_0174723018 /NCGR_PEP_ID=MMETSP1094-20130205/39840_1 /TAXON_ID=156173 /ORGANISM="Chrysochromulina brevifilum, Strain UTEX LB 985" /LENGTH=107 /DNA_ID=CAMNT_0015923987 /DNA_START=54 /DNA_END=377 /DNA_ORIENTATION=+
MAYRPGAGRGGSAAYDQHMESENDALVNGLGSKVQQLKAISIQIGSEMRDQNKQLDAMNDTFSQTNGLLGTTMKRLGLLSNGGGSCTMGYLALFVFAVLLLIWRLTK